MKTLVTSLVLLGILAVSGAYFRCARIRQRPPKKAEWRISRNEYTMEGDIEFVGDRYRIRRQVGESWVPANRVLALVASLPDAFVYLRARINLYDPDERLRLARWCWLTAYNNSRLWNYKPPTICVPIMPRHAVSSITGSKPR